MKAQTILLYALAIIGFFYALERVRIANARRKAKNYVPPIGTPQ